MIIKDLTKRGAIAPPSWMADNMAFLAMVGSISYGASGDTSDMDVYGFCIPPKDQVFPYSIGGHILGFGAKPEPFDVWVKHHVKHPDKNQEYDFQIFSIVKIFDLAMQNNPNCLDFLFVPRRCVLHSTEIGEMVREKRRIFLSKACLPKFRGYAMSQMSKIKNKVNSTNEKRAADIERHGYDTKFALHLVRLLLECEQILETHDLDIERDREVLKSIRRGEWTLDRLETWFQDKERHLEDLASKSTLRIKPDEGEIKSLLLRCLEHHYGSLREAVNTSRSGVPIHELESLIERFR